MLYSELTSSQNIDESRILRFGILGTSRIAPMALIQPAKEIPTVKVIAVASQRPKRVKNFAKKYGISRTYHSYDDLINDPEIDAVYNPLPNSMHCEWTIRALEAGKHVLCEKPIASNAAEAEKMAKTAVQNKRVLAQAFHYCHHPMVHQIKRIINSEEMGHIKHINVNLGLSFLMSPPKKDFRYRYDLSGGVTMDLGCYAIHLLRFLLEVEPEVTSSKMRLLDSQIDSWVNADFKFLSDKINCTGSMTCSFSSTLPKNYVEVESEKGKMIIKNWILPHMLFNSIFVQTNNSKRNEEFFRDQTTFSYQLRAFVEAIVKDVPLFTNPTDSIANMRVIDAVYQKAGLQPRGL